jgi:hypothetical protein
MARRSRTKAFFEGLALAIVVLFPLSAIVWAVASQTAAPPAPAAPAASAPSASTAAPAKITLDNPLALPQTVSAGQIVPFSFTIGNPGSIAATYAYKVYVAWNGGEEDVIDENSVSLAAGASADISESLKFEHAPAAGEIYIQIAEPAQSIHFTLPRT